MRIGFLSTPFFGCPPQNYGGAEQVTWDIVNGLIKRGHKVILYAPDNSSIPKGGFLYKIGPPIDNVNVDWLQAEKNAWERCNNSFDNLDILCGSNWFGFEFASKMRNPNLKVCHLHHGGLNMEIWGRSKPPFKLNMIAISNWMKRVYESQGFQSQVSYNPVDLDKYKFQKDKGDRLLFVGRLDKFKQPQVAIRVAKNLKMGLDIIGGSFVQDMGFLEMIKSQCDGTQIKLYLDASHGEKIRLYQNAKAVLFPSRMGEPFGLIVPEANACGTLVIGTRDGAIPEIIHDGESGIVTGRGDSGFNEDDDVTRFCDAILSLDSYNAKITPEKCRINAERFSIEKTAQRYEYLFKQILDGYEW